MLISPEKAYNNKILIKHFLKTSDILPNAVHALLINGNNM